MAEFIVTDPSGKEYVVTAPDGATQDQALDYAKSQFGSTPGGAAVGNPGITNKYQNAPRNADSLWSGAGELAGATALGGAAGAAMPEILQAAGAGLSAMPVTAGAGAAVNTMANIAKTVPRGVSAAAGAVSGLASEGAGKLAEAFGAGDVTAEGARLIGGVAPEFKTLAAWGVKKALVGSGLTDAWAILKRAAQSMGTKVDDLSAQQKQYMESLIGDFRGGEKSSAPMEAVYGGLNAEAQATQQDAAARAAGIQGDAASRIAQGEAGVAAKGAGITATADQQAAEKAAALRSIGTAEANNIIENADLTARKVMDDVRKGPKGIDNLRKAQNTLADIADASMEAAKKSRSSIGLDAEVSDIGTGIRDVVAARRDALKTAADKTYQATQSDVQNIVSGKESNPDYARRQFVNQTGAYRSVIADLKEQMVAGRHSPDVAKNYQKILTQLSNAEKDPFGQPKPITYQAVDDVRRMLGEAYAGKPAEGYDAIGQIAAKDLYQKVSNIQKEFVGSKQNDLLSQYAASRPELNALDSKAGKKLVGLDAGDLSQFANDPASIPGYFFKSQQGVKSLIDLTGDKAVVTQAAKDYTANQLRDKDAKGVGTWMTSNRDWLSSLPEVSASVEEYASTLAKATQRAKNIDIGIKRVAAMERSNMTTAEVEASAATSKAERDATRTLTAADLSGERGAKEIRSAASRELEWINAQWLKEQGGIQSAANKESGAITNDAQKKSDLLLGDRFPVDRVRRLIEGGSVNEWQAAAPAIAKSKEAADNIFGAVRQVVADRVESSPKGIVDFYARNVRPAIQGSGLVTPAQAEMLARKLTMIDAMQIPEAQKLGFGKRVLLQSIDGYAASRAARTKVPAPAFAGRNLVGTNASPPP